MVLKLLIIMMIYLIMKRKNGVDLIKTDIKNLVSQKSLNNLILGFYQDNDFIQAIIIKLFFE